MRQWRRIVAACAGTVYVLSGSAVHAAGGVGGMVGVEGEGVIVRLTKEALAQVNNPRAFQAFIDLDIDPRDLRPLLDFEVTDPDLAARLGLDRYFRLEVPARNDLQATIEVLSAHPALFESVEQEYWGGTASPPPPPNDEFFPIQWNLRNIGQGVECPARSAPPQGGHSRSGGRAAADISALEAWNTTRGSTAIIVAVLDSGVTPHIDLPPLLPGWSEDNLSTNDQCNHGTHVAGTIGALTDNGIGIAGVMWDVGILPVRVLRGCGGTDVNYGRGIIWAADRAHIANSSLQYYTVGTFYELAVQYAHERGLVMVAATGNNATLVAYPARLQSVIGVGATTYTDAIASFSNKGPQVMLSAPGESVYSLMSRTFVGGIATGSGCMSGTSMASPHVAGVAGLIMTINPLTTPREIERILISTADDLGTPGWNQSFGWGRLNAARAMTLTTCLVDCDMNGKVDGDDLLCFINRFVDNHPYADMNNDGRITLEDLTAYMERFKIGCAQ